MSNILIGVMVGSIRKDSYNRRLAYAVQNLAPANFEFKDLRIDDLPLYSQEMDAHYPPAAQRLKDDVLSTDALLLVTPEYNRSVPGVMKNAIDIASRPWGTNSFAGKPGSVLGTSIGAGGSALAQQHLRNSLAYLDVPVLAQPEVFIQFKEGTLDAKGNPGDEAIRALLQRFVDRYVAWVNRFVNPFSSCAIGLEQKARANTIAS
jgi:chromate reductase